MATTFSYRAINYSHNLNLKDLCNEDNYSPQNNLDTELVHLLSKLNELRLSHKVSNSTKKRNDLKWIGFSIVWIMVEIKSCSFQKKLQNRQKK
jgi:hypothetical protein